MSSYFPPSGGGGPSGSYGPPADRYGPPQQNPVVHKHVYVHVPPPEAPEYKAPKHVPLPQPPQKHYKIVFIKAPTPPTPTAPQLPPLPQPDEEKTLIYVLVKKPEEAPDVVLPTQAPTQPSKPEVYFIRYKTQVVFFSSLFFFLRLSVVTFIQSNWDARRLRMFLLVRGIKTQYIYIYCAIFQSF